MELGAKESCFNRACALQCLISISNKKEKNMYFSPDVLKHFAPRGLCNGKINSSTNSVQIYFMDVEYVLDNIISQKQFNQKV